MKLKILFIIGISLTLISRASSDHHETKSYCAPTQSCWPNAETWKAFGDSLSTGSKLHRLQTSMYNECIEQKDDAYKISESADGACMQYHDCSKEFCNGTSTVWNLPEYSVEVKTDQDIMAAFTFANTHNIPVSIKTSGHSYSGSSTARGSLLIWMYSFKKEGDFLKNFTDSCGTVTPNVIKVGGGQTWGEVYHKIASQYHIVGGGGLTVSAAGGWLQGCGLSALSRTHGIGIDNVLRFEIILPNATKVTADACENSDIFWALRGGGGGTFGVVTAVYYRLHEVQSVVTASLEIKNIAWADVRTVDSWLEKWVELSPNLDRRWGGYWTLSTFYLYFLGNMADAEATFLNDVNAWKNNLGDDEKPHVALSTASFNSYYDSRGGKDATTDKTGQATFNIASRLIPKDWVVNKKDEAVDTLRWMVRNGFYTFNYFLGGAVTDVSANATAVHPAMRKAIWQIETFDDRLIKKLREVVKDTGAGYNHAAKNEPDWLNAFWGSNLQRLQDLKKTYDPNNRLNCWHCVGYVETKLSNVSCMDADLKYVNATSTRNYTKVMFRMY